MKTLFLAIALLVSAVNINAETIAYTDTTLDAEFLDVGVSHWDVNTGLEWLDFGHLVSGSMTFGYSIDEAVAQYSPQGWRLPTYTEVYDLFDTFSGLTTDPTQFSWMLDFGTDAEVVTNSDNPEHSQLWSTGLYLDENNDVQMMGLMIDATSLVTTIYGPEFDLTSLTRESAHTNLGVFMVATHVVPIPASVWLFGTGLIGLVGVARRKG